VSRSIRTARGLDQIAITNAGTYTSAPLIGIHGQGTGPHSTTPCRNTPQAANGRAWGTRTATTSAPASG